MPRAKRTAAENVPVIAPPDAQKRPRVSNLKKPVAAAEKKTATVETVGTVAASKRAPGKELATLQSRRMAPGTGPVKKPHRYKPGTQALFRVRRLQKYKTDFSTTSAGFRRLLNRFCPALRIQESALFDLRTAVEGVMHDILLNAASLVAMSSHKRLTGKHVDMAMRGHLAKLSANISLIYTDFRKQRALTEEKCGLPTLETLEW